MSTSLSPKLYDDARLATGGRLLQSGSLIYTCGGLWVIDPTGGLTADQVASVLVSGGRQVCGQTGGVTVEIQVTTP